MAHSRITLSLTIHLDCLIYTIKPRACSTTLSVGWTPPPIYISIQSCQICSRALEEDCRAWFLFLYTQLILCLLSSRQSDVRSPKCTRHEHSVQWSLVSETDKIRRVELLIGTAPTNGDGNYRSRSNSGKCNLYYLKP